MSGCEPLHFAELQESSGLRALKGEWETLWHADPKATPFQHPDWLLCWWHHFGKGRPRVLTWRKQGRLVGLAPLYERHENGEMRLRPIGAGISDRLGPLFAAEYAPALPACLVGWIARQRHMWACCELAGLAEEVAQSLQPSSPTLRCEMREEEPCPVLPLHEGQPRLPPRLQAKLRYYRRRAERHGILRFGRVAGLELQPALDDLFALHARRWQVQGQPGVLADPHVQAFHREALPRLDSAGLLRFYRLTVAERTAAVLYALAAKERTYHYIAGFEPDIAWASPGMLIIERAIASAAAEGHAAFDFLRGREPYKYRWGARDERLYTWVFRSAD